MNKAENTTLRTAKDSLFSSFCSVEVELLNDTGSILDHLLIIVVALILCELVDYDPNAHLLEHFSALFVNAEIPNTK